MELKKGSPPAWPVVGALILAVLVGLVCSSIKGSRDGCEAEGGRARGLECETAR